ncbi:hypothetical protein FRC04_000666 [Tulasnella sp. 424]|nr:hypothetical protein FRC04_000666 [Tulasnella sp. 424]KAG8974935.1 hypothetical protein FRC05_006612 [Tulasnella sp. 425]
MKRSHPSPTNGDIAVEVLALAGPRDPRANEQQSEAMKRRRIDFVGPDPSKLPGRSGHRGTRRVSLRIPDKYDSQPADSSGLLREAPQQSSSTKYRRNSSKRLILASPLRMGSEASILKPSFKPNGAPRRRLSSRFETSTRRASVGRPSARASFAKASANRRRSGPQALNHKKVLDSAAPFSAELDAVDWIATPDEYANPLPFSETRKPDVHRVPRNLLPHQVSSQRMSESELRDRLTADPTPKTPSKQRKELPKTPLRSPTMSWEISPSDTLFGTISRTANSRQSPFSPSSLLGGPSQRIVQEGEVSTEPELPQMFSAMCDIGKDVLLTAPPFTNQSRSRSFADSALGQPNQGVHKSD